MALFSNEPEKNVRPEPAAKPQPSPVQSAPPLKAERQPGPSGSNEPCAYLDQGAKVSGKLHFQGPIRIDGQVEGEINARDITIGESALVTAQINAAVIVVAGTVKGELSASERIEIRSTARVSGNIAAPSLVVHEGAIFEGQCTMQSEGAREDRKATTRRKEERPAQQTNGQIQAP